MQRKSNIKTTTPNINICKNDSDKISGNKQSPIL